MSITKISKNGIELIKQFEGCRLSAYKDNCGIWTIGYGITNADKELTGFEIRDGLTITMQQADYLLERKLNEKVAVKVAKYNSIYHFTQNQFDALASFAYSVGSIEQLTQNGTRSIQDISNKILAYSKLGGRILPSLEKRRRAEKELFDRVKG
jgi:GH24 family phage-related lysozyme (muramidase)